MKVLSKKKFIFIALLLISLLPYSTLAMDNENVKVNTLKKWTITFNKYLNRDANNDGNITVKDSKGENIPVQISWGYYGNILQVLPPKNGYKPGETYTLTVNTSIRSFEQKNLSRTFTKVFTIIDDSAESSKEVTFADKNLEQVIREAINKPQGTICKGDVSKIVTLNGDSKGITNLQGIENLTNIQNLSLKNNQIKDLTPLKNLTDLEKLYLSDNQITDINPLVELKSLNTLILTNNQITDYSPVETYYPNLIDLDFIIIKGEGVKVDD